MPSGHSATVTSLAVYTALADGPDSFRFAVTAVLAVVICHDAMGVRLETGKQASAINRILRALDSPEARLKELVGHTPIQVAAGILLGILNGVYHFVSLG